MKPKLISADYLRDNPFAEKHMYKIYHDGDHPVATRIVRSKGKCPPKRHKATALDIAFDSLYFQAKRKGLNGDDMVDFIQAGLEKLYPASSTLRKYILEKIDKKQRNLWKRLKRFKRKTARSGILAEVRRREHYEKPSVKRKKKAEAARKRKY